MSTADLSKTAQPLVTDGRGILAADETALTVTRRLAALSIESTRESRRVYREMFFTTPGVSDFFSASSCRMRRSTRRHRPPIC
jgi:fructose-bisphosphate aldolase class I